MKRQDIVNRVEEKELVERCIAVNICPECGEDFKDKSSPSSHWTELACPNRKCCEFNKTKKSWN